MPIPQSSYLGRHAELYDLFYAEKPYAEEAAFVHRCIQAYKPNASNLLELACGTGTHSFLLEKYGYKIIATDYSPDMLKRAREKAQQVNSHVDFRQQDMRMLDISERPFDVVTCLFDSLGYVATNENILQVLKGIDRHLAPQGIFIFEFWHAGAMLRSYDPLRVRRFQTPAGEIERISETSVDYKEQLCHVSYTINELNADSTYRTLRETQLNRFFLVQEMSFFLKQAGLSPLKWYSGFHEDEQINAETWHIVSIARKEGIVE
ncbi:MAG TPA: class I SAM-dependent methyltransferase [Anaerolineales bacterium]|nr:class I SAM-dependent methyltransferase [Anaerolineales bacterium]